MGLFSHSNNENIDYERLRQDLMDEDGAQMVTITGSRGYSDMCDAQEASPEQLLAMARREGFNLGRYKR